MFDATETADLQDLRRELNDAIDQQRRSDCMARIQSDAVQLALDLVVREADVSGFFRAFIKTLVEECESRACGVWLLEDDGTRCEPWMAYVDGEFHADGDGWDQLALPRRAMADYLRSFGPAARETLE